MATLPSKADIVIIGGGVMGASTAYHLAKMGAKNIVLIEKEEFFGQGATGRCAGGIRYQFATEINISLSIASLPMLENFKEEFGQDIDLNQYGYLYLLSNQKEIEQFERNVAMQHPLEIATDWLSGLVGGFSGHDFMHGPISGKLMAEINLEGQSTSVDVSPLDFDRFEDNRLIQEYKVI